MQYISLKAVNSINIFIFHIIAERNQSPLVHNTNLFFIFSLNLGVERKI
jgi:hypothetical protein